MKSNIRIFDNPEFGKIRMKLIEGEPWFVAKDVCTALELADVSMTVKRLDDDEKLIQIVLVSGQRREMWFINESGLYNLIFQSRKPEARSFRKWITNEVLPSIRKTGRYDMHSDGDKMQDEIISKLLDIQRQQSDLIRILIGRNNCTGQGVYDFTQEECTESHMPVGEVYTEYSGNIIRNLRNKSGVSQTELAKRVKMDRSHLVHIEYGRANPLTPLFFHLIKAMGYAVSLSECKLKEDSNG